MGEALGRRDGVIVRDCDIAHRALCHNAHRSTVGGQRGRGGRLAAILGLADRLTSA
jgi:hypothetical protein